MVFLIIVTFIVALIATYNFYWKRRNLPPGPTPVPILGNMIELQRSTHWPDVFMQWSKKYGSIFTYWMGEVPIIAITDYKTIHKVFIKDGESFNDRFTLGTLDQMCRGGEFGLIFASWKWARDHRRFGLRVFRDFGVGKNQMQENILDETVTLLENIEAARKVNEEFDLFPFSDIAVGSIINNLLFGYRFTQNNKEDEFHRMKVHLHDWMTLFNSPLTRVWIAAGFVHKLPFFKTHCQKLIDVYTNIFKDMDRNIAEHKERLHADGHTEARDYVDAYLMEVEKMEARGEDTSLFTDVQLKNMAFDFWLAGQETTSTTITWGIAYLIHNVHVQEKAFEELDRVIGSDRLITMADKNDLPYMSSLVNEVQRRANLVAENVLRTASADYNLNGYEIKKGQICIAQVSAMMEDPDIFEDPKAFKPERFLDENGQVKKCDELIPFGVGKRSCLGEALARMELFLFIANLMNRYKFLPGKELPILQKWPTPSSTLIKPYQCRVIRREIKS
ncbi:unnamed protein product [Bursaphelenchus xylophilus]|uniref:(pine wood nematode) hypothetical protein n=1 Tax=Bursaphelenchus xylophilus TaxID=6326 RepID=A0A1I7RW46_BURXY|nr:cytochrome P450-33C2 [Bursaphelenchus xylophilus]CAD5214541.1 unnamed protein product [Bursaphelenchus xylophilus]CAG9095113.1 unnamed protein product [Bursaphelenchus xylophilus]